MQQRGMAHFIDDDNIFPQRRLEGGYLFKVAKHSTGARGGGADSPLARSRLDVPQQLMTIADHRAPLAADTDRERYQLMVRGETLAYLVDQEPPIVVHRWED